MFLMTDTTATCIDAKRLSKGAVRRFYDAFEQRVSNTESLPDNDESFEGDGIALMVDEEVHGLYTYKGFASLHADTTLYYPYGGVLVENRHTSHHQALIENLILELKTDSKVEIIVCLDRQPIQQADEAIEGESFWLALGFSSLDTQIYYQGAIKADDFKDKLDFSVSEYAGGDESINEELCALYRMAYKRRAAIPDITSADIEKQLSLSSCSYLIMRHNDELIGQVTLFTSAKECYVDSIYVKRSFWGTSAADQLGQSLLNYADNKGCQTVSGTAASNNRASCALMERFGLAPQYRIKRLILRF